MKIRQIMSHDVRTCGPDDTLEHAARAMWEADLGCLPVVDEEASPVGMITDRDVCMAAFTQGVALRESRVSSAMSPSVITCSPDSSIAEVEALMRDAQIRRVPVVDVTGCLVGLVTLADIARYTQSSPLHRTATPGLAKTLASITTPRAGAQAAAE